MPQLKHRPAKLFRKVRVSGSVDKDAYDILMKIAEAEKRSVSNALNLVLYEAGEKRGIAVNPHRKDDHGSRTG